MPAFVKERARVWSGPEKLPPPPLAGASPFGRAPGGGGAGLGAGHRLPASLTDVDTVVTDMMEGLIVSDHDRRKLKNDIQSQRISDGREGRVG